MPVRTRTAEDLAACVALLGDVHQVDRYPLRWPDDPVAFVFSSREVGAWVFEMDGTIVGHVSLHGPPTSTRFDLVTDATGVELADMAVVSRLFVSPSHRRAGVASGLLAHAIEAASDLGKRAVLDVSEDLTAAIEFYEARGWTHVGNTVHTFGGLEMPARVYVGP